MTFALHRPSMPISALESFTADIRTNGSAQTLPADAVRRPSERRLAEIPHSRRPSGTLMTRLNAVVRRVRALSDLCARYGVSLRSAAMAFPERFAGVASVCVGVRSPEEVTSTAATWAVEIPNQFWKQLYDSALVEIGIQSHDTSPEFSTNGSTQS
jgi:aryl-alcohol dehydrogenase-like predicted oxidoreductase